MDSDCYPIAHGPSKTCERCPKCSVCGRALAVWASNYPLGDTHSACYYNARVDTLADTRSPRLGETR